MDQKLILPRLFCAIPKAPVGAFFFEAAATVEELQRAMSWAQCVLLVQDISNAPAACQLATINFAGIDVSRTDQSQFLELVARDVERRQAAADSRFPVTRHCVVMVTPEQVTDLLSTAFEGGSNDWLLRVTKHPPATVPDGFHRLYDTPLHPDGFLMIEPSCAVTKDGPSAYRLDVSSIRSGLKTMAVKYPRHFTDLVDDNADADTADVFLQCALFGEAVFS